MLLIRDRPNVLLLRYEAFYCDVAGAVRAIAAFLKVQVSEERISDIVERFHIETVVRHTSTMKDFSEVDRKPSFHGNHVSRFKGEPGYYADAFNPEQIELIERSFYYFMQQFGY